MAKIKSKQKVLRTRNAGTMTEAAFWGFIRQLLRNGSRFWKPILQTKQKSKRKYIGTNKRQKFEYQCANCLKWFPDKQVQVDHIIPVGILRKGDDLKGFVERLFTEKGLNLLCISCHQEKTKKDIQFIKQNYNEI